MTHDELLPKCLQALRDSATLLALLDDAPWWVRSREDVQLARATAVTTRELIAELVRRVRTEIGGQDGSEKQAGAGLPPVS